MNNDSESRDWVSVRELVPTALELSLTDQMIVADSAIGASVSQRYGIDLGVAAPAIVRYPRGAVRIALRSKPARIARDVLRGLQRRVWRLRHRDLSVVAEDPNLVAGNSKLAAHGPQLPIYRYPVTAQQWAELAKALDSTSGSASGFAVLARGWVLDGATQAIIESIEQHPGADLFYGNSITAQGRIIHAPAWSPIRLREEDYLGPVVAVRVSRLLELYRASTNPSDSEPLLNLALRLTSAVVVRMSTTLGIATAHPDDLALRASTVRRALSEQGVAATVTQDHALRIAYPVSGNPLVSVVIPTVGSSGVIAGHERCFVVEAVRGLVERSNYQNIEIVVVADKATPQGVIDQLEALAGTRLVLTRWSESFNFSAIMNLGSSLATGDYLLFLNDDVDVISPGWIEVLLGAAAQPGVGMSGALLFFEDGSVQHLGHVYSRGAAGHAGVGWFPGTAHPLAELELTREVSGVTAACSLISRELFLKLGGFSSVFPGNYNDVDLCLKIRDSGLAVVCAGRAKLYHFESKSRNATIARSELIKLNLRWGKKIQREEYYR